MNNVLPFQRDPERFDSPVFLDLRERVYNYVTQRTDTGVTWKELASTLDLHHGSASGALSSLHRDGLIVRLGVTENRSGCAVYVHKDHVHERPIIARRNPHQGLVDDMAKMLRRFYRPCKHDPQYPHGTCKACDVRILLTRYDRGRK